MFDLFATQVSDPMCGVVEDGLACLNDLVSYMIVKWWGHKLLAGLNNSGRYPWKLQRHQWSFRLGLVIVHTSPH